jgi:hypothetical protein
MVINRNQVASSGMLTVILACLVLFPGLALAGQDVRVFVEKDETGTLEPRSSALQRGLEQGVLQEALGLLRHDLDEGRAQVLRDVLRPRAVGYVLNWVENEYLPTEWGGVLDLKVRVNRSALRRFLQSMGTYYTVHDRIGYALDGVDLAQADLDAVAGLEELSGLRRDGSSAPLLRLVRYEDGRWNGSLEFEADIWTASSEELSELWESLWSNYFGLQRIRGRFEQQVVVHTQGWAGVADVQGFDQILRGWEAAVEQADLLRISMDGAGHDAQWHVVTMDQNGLQSRLQSYLRERGIEYSMH